MLKKGIYSGMENVPFFNGIGCIISNGLTGVLVTEITLNIRDRMIDRLKPIVL